MTITFKYHDVFPAFLRPLNVLYNLTAFLVALEFKNFSACKLAIEFILPLKYP